MGDNYVLLFDFHCFCRLHKGHVPCLVVTSKGTAVKLILTAEKYEQQQLAARKKNYFASNATKVGDNGNSDKERAVLQQFKELYPNWCLKDNALEYTNPLGSAVAGYSFKKSKRAHRRCVTQRELQKIHK